MKVVIIGAGNVATVLGRVLRKTGFELLQVASRNLSAAGRLAGELGTVVAENMQEITTQGDLYIIAVSDNGITEVAAGLRLHNKIVVHTAGSVATKVLQPTGENFGVVYPLQSLRKEVDLVPAIPVLVNGSNQHTIEVLQAFAGKWAASVRLASDEERLKTHVAAVIASNFTNHLYALTEAYCAAESLDFQSLIPLIGEIAHRIKQASPAELQTGPAARRDHTTIDKHLQLLSGYPSLQTLYGTLTNSIMAQQSKLVEPAEAS